MLTFLSGIFFSIAYLSGHVNEYTTGLSAEKIYSSPIDNVVFLGYNEGEIVHVVPASFRLCFE